MARKRASVVVTGMNRDMSKSKFDGKFTFENHNIRISPRDESCTSFTVTNENGTELIDRVDIHGIPVGVFSCDKYIGVFSYDTTSDYITVYKNDDGTFSQYFRWKGSGLGFKDVDPSKNRIETVISVEAENSIRVYWVDGIHELRVIDFMRLKSKFGRFVDTAIENSYFSYLPKVHGARHFSYKRLANGNFRSGTVQFCVTEVINGNESNVIFTSPLLYCCDKSSGRAFAPDNTSAGNSFNMSLSLYTMARSADAPKYSLIDFCCVYAIYRSSEDSAPVVFKKEVEVSITKDLSGAGELCGISTTMNGTEEAADASHLSLLNRKLVKGIRTISEKDGLMFLGGMSYDADELNQEGIDCENVEVAWNSTTRTFKTDAFNGNRNAHKSQLLFDSFRIGHFKHSEYYALGVQLMDAYGHWSDPVPVHRNVSDDDKDKDVPSFFHLMSGYPKTYSGHCELPYFKSLINVNKHFGSGVVAVRPVVAYLDDTMKGCLYQAFATPTIYCEKERVEGQCYAKFSPFTRSMRKFESYYSGVEQNINPGRVTVNTGDAKKDRVFELQSSVFCVESSYSDKTVHASLGYQQTIDDGGIGQTVMNARSGTYPASQHLAALGCTHDYNCEIQTSWYYRDVALKSAIIPYIDISGKLTNAATTGDTDDDNSISVRDFSSTADICTHDNAGYYVDANMITLHSPDIDETTNISSSKIMRVGAVRMSGFASDTSIVASTPSLVKTTDGHYGGKPGFQHLALGSTDSGGRCAMSLPNWVGSIKDAYEFGYAQYWAVPPFGVDDFLNPEKGQGRNAERVTSVLTYKQLCNYRFCDMTSYGRGFVEFLYDSVCSTSGDYVKVEVIGNDKLIYKPAEDVVIAPSINSMWTNGPYYSWNLAQSGGDNNPFLSYPLNSDEFNVRLPLGVRPVNKFLSKNLAWQWAMYAAIFLRRNEDVDPLLFNYVNALSFKYCGNSGVSVVNYWYNRGTEDGLKLLVNNKDIAGPGLKEQKSRFTNPCFLLKEDDGKLYGVNLGNAEADGQGSIEFEDDKDQCKSYTVELKYCSTPHAVAKLKKTGHDDDVPMENYGILVGDCMSNKVNRALTLATTGNSQSEDVEFYVSEGWKKGDSLKKLSGAPNLYSNAEVYDFSSKDDCLWVYDILNDRDLSSVDKTSLTWMIAGETVSLDKSLNEVHLQELDWYQGDWFFQRWDCLRTYPKTIKDKNQVVEIVSVMLETRRNLDGRYDRNGGFAFLQANPENYNLINTSYSQKNNFFSYTIPSENDNIVSEFPCKVYWSIPKNLNSSIDNWTNLTALNSIDMDGSAGPVVTLEKLGQYIYCFQPSAISIIMYNNRTQVTPSDGIPIELATSGLVEGKLDITNKCGVTSNVAVVQSSDAIYFADEYNKRLSAISQQGVNHLSDVLGFHSWAHGIEDFKFRCFTDDRSGQVVFDVICGDGSALCFNEQYKQFESFVDIGGCSMVVSSLGQTYAIHVNNDSGAYSFWRLGTGKPNNFYGVNKPFYIDCLISEGTTDKIFDNIGFSGDVLRDGVLQPMLCPFNLIRAYSEYQDSYFNKINFTRYLPSNAKNKFRSWKTFVPRDKSKSRIGKVAERMRNAWIHIVLKFDPSEEADVERKNDNVEIQSIDVDYTEL